LNIGFDAGHYTTEKAAIKPISAKTIEANIKFDIASLTPYPGTE